MSEYYGGDSGCVECVPDECSCTCHCWDDDQGYPVADEDVSAALPDGGVTAPLDEVLGWSALLDGGGERIRTADVEAASVAGVTRARVEPEVEPEDGGDG